MTFEFQNEIEDTYNPDPASTTAEYIALIGITNNRLGIRLRPGDDVPTELIADTNSLTWLLEVKKAIELK